MTYRLLPALPKIAKVTPKLVRYGGDLTSVTGGPTQRILRLGSRYSVQVDLPPLKTTACARDWIAAANAALAEGLTLRLLYPQFGTSAAAPTVSSGAGTVVTVGSVSGIAVGQWFSYVVSGHAYLHQVTGISGSDLSVAPAVRADPSGQTLNFAAPVMEGFSDDLGWSLEMLKFAGLSFTLTEDR
jgi:hypothetical protein